MMRNLKDQIQRGDDAKKRRTTEPMDYCRKIQSGKMVLALSVLSFALLPGVDAFPLSLRYKSLETAMKLSSADDATPTAEERKALYMKTYESKSESDVKQAYKNWAPVYEMHIQDQGWQAPELCANLLQAHLPNKNSAKILDIGAGTGLVGRALADMGYSHVDALDLSTDMLEQARQKGVYQNIVVENAAAMAAVADDTYHGVISVGALNFGHIPATALREFVRVVQPGGMVAFTTRQDFYEKECRAVQKQLVDEVVWELVEERNVAQAVKDMPHIHFCYRKI